MNSSLEVYSEPCQRSKMKKIEYSRKLLTAQSRCSELKDLLFSRLIIRHHIQSLIRSSFVGVCDGEELHKQLLPQIIPEPLPETIGTYYGEMLFFKP